MGYSSASDMLANTDLRTAVSWHFSSNCYPPIPQQMLDTAIDAIDLANCDMWNVHVQLPQGVTYNGLTSATAGEIIDAYRLYAFLDEQD